jgi:predicted MFS family arabinose efflux permease
MLRTRANGITPKLPGALTSGLLGSRREGTLSERGGIHAIVSAARHPQLRRLELAYLAFNFSEFATWLAILIYAFDRGGATQASLVAVVMLIPATVAAPFTAFAGDRFPPSRALAVGYAMQGVGLGVAALCMNLDMAVPAYVAASVASAAITVTRPVMGAILPVVTHTPRDLVAANVVNTLNEQVGRCAGPLVAGLLIAAESPALVLWICAVGLLLGASAIVRVEVDRVEPVVMRAADVLGEIVGGFRALRHEVIVRWLIAAVLAGVLVVGALDILTVTFAAERLDGEGDAGLLQGALGAGAILGAAIGAGLVGGTRIIRFFAFGTALMALPLITLGPVESRAGAVVVFAVIGAGMSLTRFVGTVAMQRLAPLPVLTHIFGVLESLSMIGLAAGSLAIAPLISATSLGRGAAITGLVVAVALATCIARLRQLGVGATPPPAELFDRIVGDPLFAPLPVPTVERLAASAEHRDAAPGEAIITEGEPGDDYFLITAGEVEISQQGNPISTMGAGQSFGEIALLRECNRTATATAVGEVRMYTIDRANFLQAVTGHPRSLAEAHRMTDGLLNTD